MASIFHHVATLKNGLNSKRVAWLAAGLALLAPGLTPHSAHAQDPAPWSFAGGNTYNWHAYLSPTANVGSPTQLNSTNARKLALQWSFETTGDISSTPTIETGGLYVTDWGGSLTKLDPATGAKIWQHKVCDYTGTCYTAGASISRNSPAIGKNVVVIGDAMAHPTLPNYGSIVIGVNKATGAIAWKTVVNSTSPYGTVLGSPVIYNNVVYVGTASWDEGRAVSSSFKPSFRGNISALNADTGAILWQFTTVPAGYSGGPVPGSSMVVWPAQNALLLATGNNYSTPAPVQACVASAGASQPAQLACLDPTDYIDTVMSLDLTTGALKWSRRLGGADTWTEACDIGASYCQKPVGRDADFAQAPILTYVPNFAGTPDDRGGSSTGYMLGAGEKNSIFFGLNPLNGGLFWSRLIGTGGMEWGSSVNSADESMFYVALHNPKHVSQTISGVSGTHPTTWAAGAWARSTSRPAPSSGWSRRSAPTLSIPRWVAWHRAVSASPTGSCSAVQAPAS